MNVIKVAAASLNQTPLDWENNHKNIVSAIKEAKHAEASILCLPELCICGYGCEDAFFSPSTYAHSLNFLEKLLNFTDGICVSVGLPLFIEKKLYNSTALIADGKILGFVCKRFLANDGVHYENRWFQAWPKSESANIEIKGRKYPVGDLIFDFQGVRIGIEICEDAWNVERPAREFAANNVDIILNPSASHFAFSKLEVRKQLILESSRFCNAVYIYSNLNGLEAGRIIYDGGSMIASLGKLLIQGKRFSYKPFDIILTDVDLDQNKVFKVKTTRMESKNVLGNFKKVNSSFKLKNTLYKRAVLKQEEWENSQDIKKEEFTRAVALGLYDYMRKTKSNGFVLSLSGGVDSSSCALLIYYMALFALKELSHSAFDNILPLQDKNFSSLMSILLTTVYQSSKNSSDKTYEAAKTLSDFLECTFYNFDISSHVDNYIEMIEKNIGRTLSWEHDDKALQNIQARVRGPSVWLLANINNALLLTTSNRSEAAVGYATMDGDTCGGLCPLGGIDKPFLIEWLQWIQEKGPCGFNNVEAVKKITSLAPTAELRPKDQEQSDESDLMPYYILDLIEKAFVREKKNPREIYDTLVHDIVNEDHKLNLKIYIQKFLTLWSHNQWKRERYAPSFHLDDESLDPKSSLRYPILSGNFNIDFKELKK